MAGINSATAMPGAMAGVPPGMQAGYPPGMPPGVSGMGAGASMVGSAPGSAGFVGGMSAPLPGVMQYTHPGLEVKMDTIFYSARVR